MEYASVLKLLKQAPRPVTLSFITEAAAAAAAAAEAAANRSSGLTVEDLSRGLATFAVCAGLSAQYSQLDAHKEALETANKAFDAAAAVAAPVPGAGEGDEDEGDEYCKRCVCPPAYHPAPVPIWL
jgi:hypothetical protein